MKKYNLNEWTSYIVLSLLDYIVLSLLEKWCSVHV